MVQSTGLRDRYNEIRKQTVLLTEGLTAEDLTAQSMADASPGKWHLAHTTWFFETFILRKYSDDFHWFNEAYGHLFNSYYESVGSPYARPQRGLLTRPDLREVLEYRESIDTQMLALLKQKEASIAQLVTIGLHHEMQHQELFLTDLLHLLSHNPLHPVVLQNHPASPSNGSQNLPCEMVQFDEALVEVGVNENSDDVWSGFSYDCERPQHRTYLQKFALGTRLVNNREWIEFIEDGGYEDPLLWLSDGWVFRNREQWQAPLYWQKRQGVWFQYGLDGLQKVDDSSPVCHVSFYEADAFARWSGKRLPREHEWEYVAKTKKITGNFLDSYAWRPFTAKSGSIEFEDLYGDVWEWTQSPFTPYPGFTAKQGALGEYNGKFMSSQFVLKGGSCVTPRLQMRTSYRNFFYPHQRWQFTGVRLAEDK